jgi:outer membrane receptor protein involved in Fe transport
VQTLGGELELRREWRQGWMLAISYAWQRTRRDDVFADTDADGESTEIENSPEHLFAVHGALPLVPRLATLASRLRVEAPRLTGFDEQPETGTAILWDLMLTGEALDDHLEYGVGVRNLLDWAYEYPGGFGLAMPGVPQPGRTFYATATYLW